MSGVIVTKPAIERIVLIHNPANLRLAEQCEDELRTSKCGKAVMRLATLAGGRRPNAEMLHENLEPGDAAGVIGGDGTFRVVAGATGEVPITSLRGGNARDIGSALHRRRNLAPSKVFEQSVAVPAYLLECSVTNGSNYDTYNAASYIGCGKTAQASIRLNSDAHRNGIPILRDLQLGIGGLLSDLSFDIEDAYGENRRLSDLTFAKGSRMGKIGRFPVQHWEDRMYVASIDEGFIAGCVAAGGLILGKVAGEYTNSYEFTTLTPVGMHFDGEPPVDLEPHSNVRVGVAQNPYTVLTTQLAA
jgi:hypothetical protein